MCEMGKFPKINTEYEDLSFWDISANVNNISGLFSTHSFTISSGAVSSFPSSSQKSKKPSFSLKKFKNPFSGLRESIRGKRYPQQPGKAFLISNSCGHVVRDFKSEVKTRCNF